MSVKRVLTIEDDAAIRRGIVDSLTFAGYEVMSAASVTAGLELALGEPIDLLLLDVVLPDGDGFDVLSEIRERRPLLPVIMLTARGEESDRVRGLTHGADDYVVKPFSVKELLARVEALLRRVAHSQPSDDILNLGAIVVDFSRCEIRHEGKEPLELAEKEGELLRYLATHGGRIVSRDELLCEVWNISPKGPLSATLLK